MVGGFAAVVAIVAFGSQAVFIKSKKILRAGVDPFVMIKYFSLGIFFCGIAFFLIMTPM